MQCDARLVELLDVRAGAAGELEWIHARRRSQPWRASILPTRTAKTRITIAVRKYCEADSAGSERNRACDQALILVPHE